LSQPPISDEDLKSYLLGNMSPPARSALEDRYLSDDGIYERLLAIEEELIDQQVRGLLPHTQAAYFKRQLLLSRDGLERLKFSQALTQLHSRGRRRAPRLILDVLSQWTRRRALVPSAITAMFLLAFAILWQDFRSEGPQSHATHVVNIHTHESKTQNPPRTVAAPSSSVTLFLRSLSRGNSAGNILRVPSRHAQVFLAAEIPGDLQSSYHATIQRVDSATPQAPANIFKRAAQSGTIVVSAEFTSEAFQDGAYIFTISMETEHHSAEEIIAYAFSVVGTSTS
jgi:hypothetical protein